jgi:hypothetical protein
MTNKSRWKLLGDDLMLVIDESSKFKRSTGVRYRALRPLLKFFKRRVILTGSPRPRHYLDLFGQMFIVDLGRTLGQYITHYRNRFFFPTGFKMKEWEPLPDAPAQINELVAPALLRMDATDYLKLPGVPPDRNHRVVLPVKVQLEYDALEANLMNTLFTTPLTNSASARSKCCQIANGAVYTDTPSEEHWSKKRPVRAMHTMKVEALQDLYEELQGEPLLVAIGYRHDVTSICKALGYDVPCINGGTTRTQTSDYITQWNRGLLPLLLGHPASMGHGLNLQGCGCRHVAYYNIPDDYDQYDQFFRRVWRQGNKSAFVFRHHFVAVGTVDEAKMINMRNKGNGQNAFLKAMKEYSEARVYNGSSGKRSPRK